MRLVVFQPYKNEAVVNMFAELLNSGYISDNFPRPELITIPEEKAKKFHYNKKKREKFLSLLSYATEREFCSFLFAILYRLFNFFLFIKTVLKSFI